MRNFLAGVLMDLIVWHCAYELFRAKVHSAFHARIGNRLHHSLSKQRLLKLNQLLVSDGLLGHGCQDRLPFGTTLG